MKKPVDPVKEAIAELPSLFHSASRFFSVERSCRFILYSTWQRGEIIRWTVALEHYAVSFYTESVQRVGLKEYSPEEFPLAFNDYFQRCAASGLDAGIEFWNVDEQN